MLACALTMTVAALTLAFVVLTPDQSWVWPRVTAALCILLVSGATLAHLLRHQTLARWPLVLLGAAAMIALGAAGAVHGYHMANITGDLEAWAILTCLLLIAQGTGTILHLQGTHRAAAT